MNNTHLPDNYQPHMDYNQVRPIMLKDLQQVDAAERSYVQAHSFGIELNSNHFI